MRLLDTFLRTGRERVWQHEFMSDVSLAFAREGVATLRFNFPYMEVGRRAPDRRPILLDTVRTAVVQARTLFGDIPVFAGGKSMGGRMTSLAQSESPMPGVRGLVFLGFPLHAAGRPGSERAAHLLKVDVPLLFVQGTRDRLADIDLMRTLVDETLHGDRTLIEIDSGDHSLRVPKRTGRTTDEVLADVATRAAAWIASRVETAQE